METRLTNELKNLDKKLDKILILLKATNRLNGENILDNQDLCLLFNLTPRSLQRYRSTGELPFLRIGGKPFYLESEVYRFLKAKKQNKFPEDESE